MSEIPSPAHSSYPEHPEDLPHLPFRERFSGWAKVFACVGLLGAAGGLANFFVKTKKEVKQAQVDNGPPAIRTVKVGEGTFTPKVVSQGVVEPITATQAKAEVAGLVLWVCPQWHVGEEIPAGTVLLRLDAADYQSALAAAEARVADAALAVEMASAKAAQARRDWEKLNPGQTPDNPLVLQEPQVAAAKAQLLAAQATVSKAKRDVERCELRMPYKGKLQNTAVHVGTYVAPGTPLMECFATDRFQIRLPVTAEDARLVEMKRGSIVQLRPSSSGADAGLTAEMVRSEGVIDRTTRSVIMVAELEAGLVLTGSFLNAELPCQPLPTAKRVPRQCLQQDHFLWVVKNEEGQARLHHEPVQILRKEAEYVFFTGGPASGSPVLHSVLPLATEKMRVQVVDSP